MVFLMPFLSLSCEHEDLVGGSELAFGYSIGFPIAIVKFLIEPVRSVTIYPFGFVDLAFLAAAVCLAALPRRKKVVLRAFVVSGWHWLCVYATAHFLYNLFYPIYYVYLNGLQKSDGYMGGMLCYRALFPYMYARELLGITNEAETLLRDLRINFVIACCIYFCIGMLAYAVIRFFRRNSRRAIRP